MVIEESKTSEGPEVVTLHNHAGLEVELAAQGAALKAIRVPLGDGPKRNVVLGYTDPDGYRDDPYFMGVMLGRYANRIAGGRCFVNGEAITLDRNDDDRGNCLHGGPEGLHRQRWLLDSNDDPSTATARVRSPDGAGGFPGNLDVAVTCRLTEPFRLELTFEATSDRDTVLNLSNHAYFNLDPDAPTIDTHMLTLAAENYTPVDSTLIPSGEIRPVNGTEYDFRSPTLLANAMSGIRRRLDVNFVAPTGGDALRTLARLDAPNGEIQLLVHSTQPGFQVYTADNLDRPFRPRQGICIEAQNFPNAPNQAGFPSALLKAGAVYRQRTIYEFRVASSQSRSPAPVELRFDASRD